MKYSKKIIKAMKLLRKHYQDQLDGKKVSLINYCPLCPQKDLPWVDCQKCPWVIETGELCIKISKKYNITELRLGYSENYGNIPEQTLTKWRKRRIRELTEWIKI